MLGDLKGYHTKPYVFIDDSAKARFIKGTNRSSGPVILWGLREEAAKRGVSIPHDIEARSVYRPEMLRVPLEKYLCGGVMGSYDKKLYAEAQARVSRMFFVGKLHPTPIEQVQYKPGTSSGAPLFQKKGDVYWDSMHEAYAVRNGKCPPPLTVYHRGKNEKEVRPVFGYPMCMTLIEARFFEPYQFEVINHHNPYIGGRSYSAIGTDINEIRWKSDAIYALDYSGFDGSISADLVHAAFRIIARSFDLSLDRDKADWELVRKYFLTAPFLLPDGNLVIGRRHGVPSGSMFTQLIDSIVNCIVIEYVKLRLGFWTSRYHVLGDDSLIGVIGKGPDLSSLRDAMAELGIKLNVEKSRVRKASESKQHFLGHYWFLGVMTRENDETWRKLLAPERVDKRLFNSDDKVRKQAMIERLRAYQDDNASAFQDLQLVINSLTGKYVADDVLDFVPGIAYQERMWDESLRPIMDLHIKRGPRRFTRFLYPCS